MAEQDFPFLSDLRQWGNLKEDLPEGVFFCEIALVWNLGWDGTAYGPGILCGERNKKVDSCFKCEMFDQFKEKTGRQFGDVTRWGMEHIRANVSTSYQLYPEEENDGN